LGPLQVGLLCSVKIHDGFDILLALGLGGLAVGALATEAFEHHEERERDEAYEQG
jgi:hypothetical protein